MKTVTIKKPSDDLKGLLDASKGGRVLLKRDGKPVALVINVQDKDEEQIRLENDPEFWRMIQARRSEPTVPWEEVKAEFGIGGTAKKPRPSSRRQAETKKATKR